MCAHQHVHAVDLMQCNAIEHAPEMILTDRAGRTAFAETLCGQGDPSCLCRGKRLLQLSSSS
jgi:hypothetical protein